MDQGNNRREGFSLRRALVEQGIDEKVIKSHITFVAETLSSGGKFDITRYRADPTSPNNPLPEMG